MLVNEENKAEVQALCEKGFHDLPMQDYVKAPGINAHGLMDIRRSPKYFQFKKSQPYEPDSPSMGTLVHSIILEPELFEKKMKLKKKVDGRTKEGKEYNAEFELSLNPGDLVVDESQYEELLRVKRDLEAHSFINQILGRGRNEVTAHWVHPVHNVLCKSRLDKVMDVEGLIVDLKTTGNASEYSFQKEIVNLNYELQAVFYMDAYRQVYGKSPRGYVFIAIELGKCPHFGIYTLEQSFVDHGVFKVNKAMLTYKACLERNEWPGYPESAVPLDLPGFAVYQEQ